MDIAELDQAKAAAFGDRLLAVLNDGCLALMISIGHRTALFDTMAGLAPATSQQIAKAAGLQERYVREWLGAMVTGRVVKYDPRARTYLLPAEHAATLTRAAAPNNMAAFAQYVPLLGAVEDDIVRSFSHGGGVPYEDFPRFQAVMSEDSGQSVVPALFAHILPLVPGLIADLERGIDVLDLGCGRGRALIEMARAFPNSRFVGYDLSEDGIAYALAAANRYELHNLRFALQDAAQLKEVARYDLICTFDAIHDQAAPAQVLHNIARALRADGTYLMQDIRASVLLEKNIDHPAGTFLYTVSCLHCMTVSLAAGGAGLGAMWGEEQALQMLAETGFLQVTVHQLAHDFQNNYYVARKSLRH